MKGLDRTHQMAEAGNGCGKKLYERAIVGFAEDEMESALELIWSGSTVREGVERIAKACEPDNIKGAA